MNAMIGPLAAVLWHGSLDTFRNMFSWGVESFSAVVPVYPHKEGLPLNGKVRMEG